MFKKPYHFDFDEDADPVEELHRLREAKFEYFKGDINALHEYYRSMPSVEELLAQRLKEVAEKKAKKAQEKKNAVPQKAKLTMKEIS